MKENGSFTSDESLGESSYYKGDIDRGVFIPPKSMLFKLDRERCERLEERRTEPEYKKKCN